MYEVFIFIVFVFWPLITIAFCYLFVFNSRECRSKFLTIFRLFSSCGEQFATPEELEAHKKIHRTCPECLLELPTVPLLESHMRKEHGTSTLKDHWQKTRKNILCPFCGRVFVWKWHLLEHYRSEHPGQGAEPEKCKECGKSFKNMRRLKDHMLRHSDKKTFVCNTCGKAFKTAGNLFQHKQQHLPKKFVCGCGERFTYPHGLKRHKPRCLAGLPIRKAHSRNMPAFYRLERKTAPETEQTSESSSSLPEVRDHDTAPSQTSPPTDQAQASNQGAADHPNPPQLQQMETSSSAEPYCWIQALPMLCLPSSSVMVPPPASLPWVWNLGNVTKRFPLWYHGVHIVLIRLLYDSIVLLFLF